MRKTGGFHYIRHCDGLEASLSEQPTSSRQDGALVFENLFTRHPHSNLLTALDILHDNYHEYIHDDRHE
jgi:hypothetical protein